MMHNEKRVRRVSQFAGRAGAPGVGARLMDRRFTEKRQLSVFLRAAHCTERASAAFGNFHWRGARVFPVSRCPPARVRVCRGETMIYNGRPSGRGLVGLQWGRVFLPSFPRLRCLAAFALVLRARRVLTWPLPFTVGSRVARSAVECRASYEPGVRTRPSARRRPYRAIAACLLPNRIVCAISASDVVNDARPALSASAFKGQLFEFQLRRRAQN